MAPSHSPCFDQSRRFGPTYVLHTYRQPLSGVSVWQGEARPTLLRSGCVLSFGGGPPKSVNFWLPLSENGILKLSTEHRRSIPQLRPRVWNPGRGKREGGAGAPLPASLFQYSSCH